MKKPSITVLMPVFNGGAYLGMAIESVLSQSFSDFELLIIDDGSTDDSLSVIQSYDDPRIRVMRNGHNRGLSVTRNRGLAEAEGDFIALLDCDDVCLPGRFDTQYAFMTSNPHVALCGGRAIFIDKEGVELFQSEDYSMENSAIRMVFHNMFINSTIMMKTDVARELRYSGYPFAEDYDLSLRISRQYTVCNLKDYLVKYRTHGDNVSIKKLDEIRRYERKIISDTHEYLGMNTNNYLIDIQQSFITNTQHQYKLADYYALFKALIEANNISKRYPAMEFNEFIFGRWYELVRLKAGKEAFFAFTRKPIFDWRFCKLKQLRKVFKQSIGIGRLK